MVKSKRVGDDTAVDQNAFVATSTAFAFSDFQSRADRDDGPNHVLGRLTAWLEADLRQPTGRASRLDKVAARVVGMPEHWALARSVVADARDGDLVYASGDDVGLAIALTAVARRRRLKLAVFYTAPRRVRARLLTMFVVKAGLDLLAVAGSPDKVEALGEIVGSDRAVLAPEQTDTKFFRPTVAGRDRDEPLVVSCGLEQRDYRTLARAIGNAYEAKICAVSPNFTSKTTVAMPEVVPESMEMRSFDFAELRSLYQHATVTVVPVLDNLYSAGTTTMIEAIACGSPVIVTHNPGLAADFIGRDLVVGVPPSDAEAMRSAVDRIIAEPAEAAIRAERARAHVLEHHSDDRYVERLGAQLLNFWGRSSVASS